VETVRRKLQSADIDLFKNNSEDCLRCGCVHAHLCTWASTCQQKIHCL